MKDDSSEKPEKPEKPDNLPNTGQDVANFAVVGLIASLVGIKLLKKKNNK
ncbi:LPXTG cell wall anchor domain-containing protein [Clostridium perfringens]|nr:LPXTG cell wall anchor domain-containing protein [Clostridium perfringens]